MILVAISKQCDIGLSHDPSFKIQGLPNTYCSKYHIAYCISEVLLNVYQKSQWVALSDVKTNLLRNNTIFKIIYFHTFSKWSPHSIQESLAGRWSTLSLHHRNSHLMVNENEWKSFPWHEPKYAMTFTKNPSHLVSLLNLSGNLHGALVSKVSKHSHKNMHSGIKVDRPCHIIGNNDSPHSFFC